MLLVPIMGWGFAHWDHGLSITRPGALVCLLFSWALLSAGTMWLNAALDGEEGEALFAEPASRPEHVATYGYVALALAVAVAFFAEPRSALVCAACALLAVLYSHPKTAWKSTTLLGPLVSAVGYGWLSALAGHFIARMPLSGRTLAAFSLFAVAVYGLAVGAQAFQRDDDARRRYRTFVVVHSPEACVRSMRACIAISVLGTSALMVLGVYPRLCLLGLPVFFGADRSMRAWQTKPRGGSARDMARSARWLLAGLATFVLLAFIDDRW